MVRDIWLVVITAFVALALLFTSKATDKATSSVHHTETLAVQNRELAEFDKATAASACQAVSIVAAVAAETLEAQIKTNKALLPRISLNGLTHAELVKLSRENEERERHKLARLEVVAHAACAGEYTNIERQPNPNLHPKAKHKPTATQQPPGVPPVLPTQQPTLTTPIRPVTPNHTPRASTGPAPTRRAPPRAPAPTTQPQRQQPTATASTPSPTHSPPEPSPTGPVSPPIQPPPKSPLGLPCVTIVGHEINCGLLAP